MSKLSVILQGKENLTQVFSDSAKESTKLRTTFEQLTPVGKKLALSNERLTKDLGKSGNVLDQHRRKAAELGRQYKSTTNPTNQLTRAHERQQKAVRKAAMDHARLKRELKGVKLAANQQGMSLDQLASKARRAGTSLSSIKTPTVRGVGAMGSGGSGLGGFGGAALAGGLAYGIKSALMSPISEMRALEAAKGDFQGLLGADSNVIVEAALKTTRDVAGLSATSFVKAAYDIQSGINGLSSQGVADITTTAALIAKATKGNVTGISSLMGTAFGTFKSSEFAELSNSDFANTFGAGLTATVQMFKTDGAKMQQAMQSAGSEGSNLGVSMNEQLAVLGMLQGKMEAGVAGTTFKSFINKLPQADKKFEENGMNVRTLDDNGKALPIHEILQQLKGELGEEWTGDTKSKLLKVFGSEEAVNFVASMWENSDKLLGNYKAITKASKQGAEYTQKSADAAQDDFNSRWALAVQKGSVAMVKVGYALMPALEVGIRTVSWLADGLVSFIDKYPLITKVITTAVLAIGGIAAIVAPVALAMTTLSMAMRSMGLSARVASGQMATSGAIAASSGFGSKFSKLGDTAKKLGRLGVGLTALFAAERAASVFMDDKATTKDKVSAGTGLAGGLAGLAAGAAAGAVAGPLGSLIGSGIGYFWGDKLGSGIGGLYGYMTDDNAESDSTDIDIGPRRSSGNLLITPETIAKLNDGHAQRMSRQQMPNRTSNSTININQLPGESSEILAERVAKEITIREQMTFNADYADDPFLAS